MDKKRNNIYTGYINENCLDKENVKKAKMSTKSSIDTDPFGSYTGVPTDGDGMEMPVQDVDDL